MNKRSWKRKIKKVEMERKEMECSYLIVINLSNEGSTPTQTKKIQSFQDKWIDTHTHTHAIQNSNYRYLNVGERMLSIFP